MSTTFDWRSRRTALTALIVLALAAVGGAALVRSEHATGQESGQPASSFSVFGQAGPRPTAAQAASLGDLKDPSNQAPFALDPALDRVAQQTRSTREQEPTASASVMSRSPGLEAERVPGSPLRRKPLLQSSGCCTREPGWGSDSSASFQTV